ncbi:Alb1-domain-containing protein [Neohortaea acidophila]|uniref:Alb1-domain-containing protein n=1 Tax=Neohortaea acidophila TaxID=245834 RepID=A0A6A6Q3A4_9PEZI|nr:Alb1-domain-containing protein [Neohortaea acidophila]KAF2486133.1 Alb1-domain-containing protein [Neohortaea acidophila]
MGKTPKPKAREQSVHSRAARRQATPPPTSSLAAKQSAQDVAAQPWIHHAQNAGIAKKKKAKPLTRQQRLRHQRGMENAARNVDRLEKKVAESKRRGRKVRDRRTEWEELNGKVEAKGDGAEVDDAEEIRAPMKADWTKKMVEVELEEALEEIEGFELPSIAPQRETVDEADTASLEAAPKENEPLATPTAIELDEVT